MKEQRIERDGKTFVAVCSSAAVKPRQGLQIGIDESTELALFRVDGQCYSLMNSCPHQHHTTIANGFVERDTVICPMHGWQFNIRTGDEITGLGKIKTFVTLEVDGVVYVEYNAEAIPSWMK